MSEQPPLSSAPEAKPEPTPVGATTEGKPAEPVAADETQEEFVFIKEDAAAKAEAEKSEEAEAKANQQTTATAATVDPAKPSVGGKFSVHQLKILKDVAEHMLATYVSHPDIPFMTDGNDHDEKIHGGVIFRNAPGQPIAFTATVEKISITKHAIEQDADAMEKAMRLSAAMYDGAFKTNASPAVEKQMRQVIQKLLSEGTIYGNDSAKPLDFVMLNGKKITAAPAAPKAHNDDEVNVTAAAAGDNVAVRPRGFMQFVSNLGLKS